MRTNLRPSARATDCPRLVLPTPGGPTRHRIGPRTLPATGAASRDGPIPPRDGPLPSRDASSPSRDGPIPPRDGPFVSRDGPISACDGPIAAAADAAEV